MSNLVSDVMIELHVPDFEIAKIFYSDLGFKVVWERKNVDESILNFFGGDETVYNQHYFKQFFKSTPRGYQVEITIPIDGLDKFYKKIQKKHNKLIVLPLKENAFRANQRKDFRMIDPFGFYLCFVERYDWVNGRDKQGNPIIK